MQPAPVSAAEDAAARDRQTEERSSGLIVDTETRHVLPSGGGELEYVARAGTLTIPEAGEEGARGRMFYVAYTTESAAAERPITFVFNGGPGAAAAYLHLGATSAYVGDNTDLIQHREALKLVRRRLLGVVAALGTASETFTMALDALPRQALGCTGRVGRNARGLRREVQPHDGDPHHTSRRLATCCWYQR